LSLPTVLLPLFVEVILTFALLFWVGALADHRRSTAAAERGPTIRRAQGLRSMNWPAATTSAYQPFAA
jgi:hypothetical protein